MLKRPKSFRDKFHELAFNALLGPRSTRQRYGFTRHCGERECRRRRSQIAAGSLRQENGLAVKGA